MNLISFGIIGGDLRQIYMANALCDKGFKVLTYGIDNNLLDINCIKCTKPEELIKNTNNIILPVPLLSDGKILNKNSHIDISPEEVLPYLNYGHYIFAGCIPKNITTYFKKKNISFTDFMLLEPVVLFNTIATAEGAICEAICNTPINIEDSKILITGYGRCAKTLAFKLKGLGALVTICARNEASLEEARRFGFNTENIYHMSDIVSGYDIIFNTVPAMVIDRTLINNINLHTLIIDIASKPGGVDFKACREQGIKALHSLGLPGIYAPKSTGDYLMKVLLVYISQSPVF